jgi:hypothetical protein
MTPVGRLRPLRRKSAVSRDGFHGERMPVPLQHWLAQCAECFADRLKCKRPSKVVRWRYRLLGLQELLHRRQATKQVHCPLAAGQRRWRDPAVARLRDRTCLRAGATELFPSCV